MSGERDALGERFQGMKQHINEHHIDILALETRLTTAEQERDEERDRADALEEFARIQRERADIAWAKVTVEFDEKLRAELTASQAEVARLREALERIAHGDKDSAVCWHSVEARTALSTPEGSDG